jgi:HEAT repeat protein
MNPAEGLSSPKRVDHLVALRNFEQQKMEITAFPQYKELLHSTDMSERYWLARTLAYSHRPESYDHLLELLSDSEPIVRCQALYALGQRVEARAIEPILAHIISSDHWYVQWYGYGALRTLGWHQEPLH